MFPTQSRPSVKQTQSCDITKAAPECGSFPPRHFSPSPPDSPPVAPAASPSPTPQPLSHPPPAAAAAPSTFFAASRSFASAPLPSDPHSLRCLRPLLPSSPLDSSSAVATAALAPCSRQTTPYKSVRPTPHALVTRPPAQQALPALPARRSRAPPSSAE